ncbi:hypothetical protein [Gracilimonas sediminicola]|uniref:hypothetical protein n=1 Tax=Gracilimonas sediminicola TaxID=2952158 RepID=UPI0038D476A4
MADTIAEIDMKIIHCCQCGMPFAMTEDFSDRRLKDGKNFYCPKGHSQYYTSGREKDKEIEKLKGERDRYKNRMYHYKEEAEHKENQRRGHKAAHTRLKNKIQKGECPCCGEVFSDLKHHMESQHPDYQDHEELQEQG